MQHLPGNLFILSAPSGAGKSSLINALLAQHSDMQLSVSHTTRAPRPGETDGVHYHFVSVDQFKQLIAEGVFLEWAEVFGNYYGTSRAAIEACLLALVSERGPQKSICPSEVARALGGTSRSRVRPVRTAMSARKGRSGGAPSTIRTCDLCLRRATLYPAELWVRAA